MDVLAPTMKNGSDKRTNRKGKVIRLFTIELVPAGSDPALDVNPANPYTELSEEARLRDFIETFGVLWAESCREASKKDKLS